MRKHPWTGAGVLVVKNKYADLYFNATTDYDFNESVEKIIVYNKEFGFYDEIMDEVTLLLEEGSDREMWDFLQSRSDYEYEGVEYCEFEQ